MSRAQLTASFLHRLRRDQLDRPPDAAWSAAGAQLG
jgi:hypothetical protein